ncbi:MAG TPA: hypothetical protein VG328_21335 [Stellaceae bacterium]|nr:hypothetical protein [Stellaceae bacterium]
MAQSRSVLLTGSIPLRPAEKVFETVAKHLGSVAPRIPDGEQIGWSSAARRTFERHPALELSRQVPLNAGGKDPVDIFRLRPGFAAGDLVLGPYGYVENATRSYAAFKKLKDDGVIPAKTRYQVTLPGPGTIGFCIELDADTLLPLAREALAREVEGIAAAIPAADLAIQLDIGMEAEHEEYLRRPDAWDQPLHRVFHWSLAQMADSVAWLANRVPAGVELGFHICSIWHHDPAGGQDNRVLVDAANAILERVTRRVDYIHLPVIPEHRQEDYTPFKDLALSPDTYLYLGLVNIADGVEGAKRRIAMAEKVVPNFGVGSFCGLGRPPLPDASGPTSHSHPPIPELTRATPETIGAVLDLHRQVAAL